MAEQVAPPSIKRQKVEDGNAPLLLGFGNPTVDATLKVPPEELAALGLEAGTETAGASAELKRDIVRIVLDNPCVELGPGGAALNSMRVAKWAAGPAIRAAFLGSVGKDKYADLLTGAMEAVGVKPLLLEVDDATTALCAALVDTVSKDRTLAVVRGAAGCISAAILDRTDVAATLQKASLIYVTSFVLSTPQRAALAKRLAEIAEGRDIAFAMNLSSAGLLPKVDDIVMALLPKCRYVFGNEAELKAFALLRGWAAEGDTKSLVQQLAGLCGPGSVVVITQGADATLFSQQGSPPVATPVPFVSNEDIVDTNGCGDSFVGGFLSKIAQGAGLNEAVAEAHRCSGQILRRQGCDLTQPLSV